MKDSFEMPTAEVVRFDASDVIATSAQFACGTHWEGNYGMDSADCDGKMTEANDGLV